MTTLQMGQEGFRWFLGIVEDVEDPLKLGRVRARIINEHNDYIKTSDLPWSQVMMPVTSTSVQGIGDTPSLTVASRVIGFFIDGNEKQFPMIIGSYPVIPQMDDNLHSLSFLARGKQSINKDLIGPEPKSAYAAEYPNNRVIQTRAGHVIELDDTPNNERVHIFHKSGSYVEINKDGRVVIKAVDDSYDIVGNNKLIYIEGNTSVQVNGNLKAIAKGEVNVSSEGPISINSSDKVSINAVKGVSIKSGTGISMAAPGGVVLTEGSLSTMGAISSAVGVTGTFTSITGEIIHIQKGQVTNIT